MANHNQFKRISTTPQANTIPYADENGFITAWLDNDPLINSLKQQNQLIGSVETAPAPDTQSILTQFVVDTVGRQPRNGDEVSILDVGELWRFNGTDWIFFTDTIISDASTTEKGLMQVGTGLLVNNGLVSVDSSIYTPSRTTITNPSTTDLSIQANTDYVFTNALTSLSLGTIANSPYFSTLAFETGNTFSWSAPSSLEYYFVDQSDIQSFFTPNTKYELVITNGKCHINYIGARKYPINKITTTNTTLTVTSNIATWTISNTLGVADVFVRVYETSTGNTVEVDSTITASTITLKIYSDSATISAGTYTAVILG